jgi:hypothetical protein
MDKRRTTKLMHDIGAAITSDRGVSRARWESIALVVTVGEGCCQMFGYLYRGTEIVPLSIEGDSLFELFPAWRDAMGVGEKSKWKQCLFTITKPDLEMEVDFEYTKANRWRVTPKNIDTLPAQLRRVEKALPVRKKRRA